MSIDWDGFVRYVDRHECFVLTSHIRPDCDAIGSELGMAHVLRRCGKQAAIVNADPVPEYLSFLPGVDQVRTLPWDFPPERIAEFAALPRVDTVLVLDASSWNRLGAVERLIQRIGVPVGVLDHHVSEDTLGDDVFKETTAEATGRLVVEAADALGVALDATAAVPLFAAMATDTGWFRFDSVTQKTFGVATRLVAAGANPSILYGKLYDQETYPRLKLRGLVLDRLERFAEGRIALSYVLREDYPALGATPNDTEGLVNLPLTLPETVVTVLLTELPEGGFKISLRSRGHFDCTELAEPLGGGGHRAASGAKMAGDLATVRSHVLDAARRTLG